MRHGTHSQTRARPDGMMGFHPQSRSYHAEDHYFGLYKGSVRKMEKRAAAKKRRQRDRTEIVYDG